MKTISLHLQKCRRKCTNKDVCYHRDREGKTKCGILKKVLEYKGKANIHYSVCKNVTQHVRYLANHNYVGITIPYSLIYSSHWSLYNLPSTTQVSVHTFQEMFTDDLVDVQKLYLIKDNTTYDIAIAILGENSKGKNIHFPIYQKWIKENKEKLYMLIEKWLKTRDTTLSLDSCLTGFLHSKECPYKNNYIDITFDGKFCKCPFSNNRKSIGDRLIEDLFSDNFEVSCIYKTIFGG